MSETLADRVRLRIRIEMVRRDLNMTQLAALAGVGEMWLSRRLRGKTEMHLGDLEKLADALGMEPDTLMEPAA